MTNRPLSVTNHLLIATGHLRGHPIYHDGTEARYCDTGELAAYDRGGYRDWCGHCGEPDTPEGHDACLGTIPGAMNACCGHGSEREAYVQYPDGRRVAGAEALAIPTEIGD